MAVNREDFANIVEEVGNRLPYWARSTNPIVRRHLGFGWRTVPPEVRPLIMGAAIWIAVLAIGFLIPSLLNVVMMLFIASILIMPVAILLYGHVLVEVTTRTASIMQEELRNNTLNLLMTTPMTLEQIFMGKISAALWTRVDDWIAVAQLSLFFGPPILFSNYAAIWSPETEPLTLFAVIVLGIVISLIRLILEPLMFGIIAIVVGIVVPYRSTAITSTLTLGAFYVLLMNLLPYLPDIAGRPIPILLVSFALPLILPLIIIPGGLWLAHRIVTRD